MYENIKIATIEDLELVVSIAMKFVANTPYSEYASEDKIRGVAMELLNSSNDTHVVLLYEDVGMIAGVVSPFLYGDAKMATELAWWIEPTKRGVKAGKELKEAFEYWAKKAGAAEVIMSCLDDKVSQLLEKDGYVLRERAYMKSL